MKRFIFVLTQVTLVLLSGCGRHEIKELRSSKAYSAVSLSTPSEITARVQDMNGFGFSLFQRVVADRGDENLLISPMSLQAMFALLYPGTGGQSQKEMSNTLLFKEPVPAFREAMKGYLLHLQSLASKQSGKKFELSMHNRVWLDEKQSVRSEYLDQIQESFNAGIPILDIAGDPEGARDIINEEIGHQTKDRIKDLIPKGVLTSGTPMVVTNAIYLYADWASQFSANETSRQNFRRMNGSVAPVEMMHGEFHAKYFETDRGQAVSLPYADDRLAMMVILPKEPRSVREIESALKQAEWDELLGAMSEATVDLHFPKFEMAGETFSLSQYFKDMGMASLFNPLLPNFPNLFEDANKASGLSDVLHKTYIKVDEKGTEAAAASASGLVGAGYDPNVPKVMRVDHPALFAIYDTTYGGILFLGRLAQP